jgi:hypothetical protein
VIRYWSTDAIVRGWAAGSVLGRPIEVILSMWRSLLASNPRIRWWIAGAVVPFLSFVSVGPKT